MSLTRSVLTVLHLIDTGGPGGAETVFAQLVTAGFDKRIRPLILVPREGWLADRLRSLSLEPLIVPARGSLNFRYLVKLISLSHRHRIRLIHAHLFGSSVYGGLLGLLLGIPVIAVLHGPTDLRSHGKLAFAKKWVLQRCSAIVAVSESTRGALINFGVPATKISLIPNGVDTATYVPGRASDLRVELGLDPEDVIIGAVGNIRSPKAYDVLLLAAHEVLKRAPRACFVVIGEGDDRSMLPLLKQRDELGLGSRLHFLGFRKSTARLFHNFDVFVSSSRSEGLSLSFLEAMASGKAIVATRSGGPQEVMTDDEDGLLVPIEDPGALADALVRCATDVQLRERLGLAARERVQQGFSLEAALGRYLDLYSRLLQLEEEHGTKVFKTHG